MLLAGSGLSAASNMAQPKVQAPGSKVAAGDGVPVSQPANTPPCSGLPSPLSVSSHTGAQSGSGSTSTDEFLTAKTAGVTTTSVSNVEPPKVVSATTMLTSGILAILFLTLVVWCFFSSTSYWSLVWEYFFANYILTRDESICSLDLSVCLISKCFYLMILAICHAAVPQARKASLARFLEKRKERLVFYTWFSSSSFSSSSSFFVAGVWWWAGHNLMHNFCFGYKRKTWLLSLDS